MVRVREAKNIVKSILEKLAILLRTSDTIAEDAVSNNVNANFVPSGGIWRSVHIDKFSSKFGGKVPQF